MSDRGSQFIDAQNNAAGSPAGPKLLGDLFIPTDIGLTFIARDGRWFQLRLRQNADGSTWYDENNKPTLELNEIRP